MSPDLRLYYTDPYLRRFEAQVTGSEGNKVYLDQTAFYPSSGGQPHDLGTIAGVRVEDVVDEESRIAHVIAGVAPSGTVECEIDWPRRFDHMQQHTGQHLLSAVLSELYSIQTLSFHLGAEASTIDVDTPSLDAARLSAVENRVNEIVFDNRPVSISFAGQSAALGLRKESQREGELRIVSIEDLDRSACGGTHVRSTAEIGPVLIGKLDKIRGSVRIEFVCGMRAVRRARADYQALSKVARLLSVANDEVATVVAAQLQRAQEAEKTCRKLTMEAAARQGHDIYAATEPDAGGIRRAMRTGAIGEEMRAVAQAFTAMPRAVFIAICEDPPSVMVAASKDSGVNAGELVKASVTANGGRGGGSAVLAQGSVPSKEALQRVRYCL